MWDYLYMHEYLRLIIIAIIIAPMIILGALLRKKASVRPYYNSLGLIAHFMCIAMGVALLVGDFYVGWSSFPLLSYVIGVGFSLILIIIFIVLAIIYDYKYKKTILELK